MLTITIDEKTVYKVESAAQAVQLAGFCGYMQALEAAQAVQLAGFCGYMQALEDDDSIWNRYENAIKALIDAVRNGELE